MAIGREIGREIASVGNLIKRHRPGLKEGQEQATTRMQRWIIGYMYNKNGDHRCMQKDVEEAFCITRSTASTILSLMEERGLIVRTPSVHDARCKELTLSSKAVSICEKVAYHVERIETLMRKNISEEDLEIFFSVLERIQKNLEEDDGISCCESEGKETHKND